MDCPTRRNSRIWISFQIRFAGSQCCDCGNSCFRFLRLLHRSCLGNFLYRSLTSPIRTNNLLPRPLFTIPLVPHSLPFQSNPLLSRSSPYLPAGFLLIRRGTKIPKRPTQLLHRSLLRTPRHLLHGGFLARRARRLFPAIRNDTALLSILERHSSRIPERGESGGKGCDIRLLEAMDRLASKSPLSGKLGAGDVLWKAR